MLEVLCSARARRLAAQVFPSRNQPQEVRRKPSKGRRPGQVRGPTDLSALSWLSASNAKTMLLPQPCPPQLTNRHKQTTCPGSSPEGLLEDYVQLFRGFCGPEFFVRQDGVGQGSVAGPAGLRRYAGHNLGQNTFRRLGIAP